MIGGKTILIFVGDDKMNKSRIFTDAEMEAIERRKQGNKTDKTGIFCGRIKPKLIEMLEYWFPKKKQLQKLVIPASHKENKKSEVDKSD